MAKVRIATWNIGNLVADYDKGVATLLNVVKQDQPDILCLEEFPSSADLLEKVKFAGNFSDYLHVETSQSHVASGWKMGVIVFSKRELHDTKVTKLTLPTEEIFFNGVQEFWHPKCFVKASVVFDRSPVAIIAGHGFPFYRYHLQEEAHAFVYREIDTFVKDAVTQSESYVIAADFNAQDAVRFMPFVNATHEDIFKGQATRPSGRKTDAIVCAKGAVRSAVVNMTVEGFDHNFLSATIAFDETGF